MAKAGIKYETWRINRFHFRQFLPQGEHNNLDVYHSYPLHVVSPLLCDFLHQNVFLIQVKTHGSRPEVKVSIINTADFFGSSPPRTIHQSTTLTIAETNTDSHVPGKANRPKNAPGGRLGGTPSGAAEGIRSAECQSGGDLGDSREVVARGVRCVFATSLYASYIDDIVRKDAREPRENGRISQFILIAAMSCPNTYLTEIYKSPPTTAVSAPRTACGRTESCSTGFLAPSICRSGEAVCSGPGDRAIRSGGGGGPGGGATSAYKG